MFHSKLCLVLLVLAPVISAQNSVSDALNSFAIKLLSTTTNEAGNSLNVAQSPFTVWSLLTVIAEGANGNTARQLDAVLNLPSNKDAFRRAYTTLANSLQQPAYGVNLDISNAIFTSAGQKLHPRFQDISQKVYGVSVQPINFGDARSATKIINSHIAKATRNRIQDFVNSGDLTDATIFMTSALFFKGQWMSPFNGTATSRDVFYDEKQNRVGDVNMMYQSGFFPYARLEFLRAYAVELPYGNGEKMSMIVILPFKDETILSVLSTLSKGSFSKVVDSLSKAKQDYADDEVQVYLPKFAWKSDLNLNVVLEKMGIRDMFNSSSVDLLGIIPNNYLWVSRVIQRADIEVNEEGTVASAASGAALTYKSPQPKFQANRPFLYFIVDNPTKSIVFSGKITNPNTLR